MKINFNTTKFCGYKNLIHTDMHDTNSRFSMLAMQLNNEDGFNDLTTYQDIFKLHEEEPGDVVSFLYIKQPDKRGRFLINDDVLLWGDELCQINKEYSIPNLKKNFQKIEKFNLKTYTLLASLTKRLMNISMVTKDNEMGHTVQKLHNILKKVVPSEKIAMDIIQKSFFEEKPFQKLSLEFNNATCKTMQKYFKLV